MPGKDKLIYYIDLPLKITEQKSSLKAWLPDSWQGQSTRIFEL